MKLINSFKKPIIALAPMAGCADRAFREICIKNGASFTVGELCSAKGVSMGDQKSQTLLYISDKERPMASQLFGSDINALKEAAISAAKYCPDFLDINMGCPAPKVAGNGGGSALLKDPVLARDIIKAVKSVTDIPVTAKMRIGWDEESINGIEFAKYLCDGGADMITVHGRTRKQMYSGKADREYIAKIKAVVNTPIIANGDIDSIDSAKDMFKVTNADGIMIGRAALGNPFIFKKLKTYFETGEVLSDETLEEKLNTLLLQCELMLEYKDPHNAVLESRKHAAWYLKGMKNAAKYRRYCNEINSLSDIKFLIETVLKENEV